MNRSKVKFINMSKNDELRKLGINPCHHLNVFLQGVPQVITRRLSIWLMLKNRYKQIEKIKQRVALLNEVIGLLEAEPEKREMNLPSDIIKEIMAWQKAEGTPR